MQEETSQLKTYLNYELIRKKRLSMKKTQEEVATDLGIKTQTYVLWEKGKSQPSWQITISLKQFADYFECAEEELFIKEWVPLIKEQVTFDGELLKKKRLENGWTREQLANLFNNYYAIRDEVTPRTISSSGIYKYEKNLRQPNAKTLSILANLFGCSETDFRKDRTPTNGT